MQRWVPTLLLPSALAVACGVAMAGSKADAVNKLMDGGKYDKAAERCEKWDASSNAAEADLREACAAVYFPEAEQQNTVQAWTAYRETWAGTEPAQLAFTREAKVALTELGPRGSEADYEALAARYRGTQIADDAWALAADAAVRDCKSADDARRVADKYPDHPGLPALYEEHLAGLVALDFSGSRTVATLDPPLAALANTPIIVTWGALHPEGNFIEWDMEAARHLAQHGLARPFIDSGKRDTDQYETAFPRCFDPSAPAGWKLGLQVKLGRGTTFIEAPAETGCDESAWPAFLIIDNGKASALSLRPGHTIFLATVANNRMYTWGGTESDPDSTRIYLPATPGTPLLVGDVIGQRVGKLFLVHPLGGGLPWYTVQPPPTGALSLLPTLGGTDLPPGWTKGYGDGGTTMISSPKLVEAGITTGWKLPRGDFRVLTPLLQQVTGLSPLHPALQGPVASELPPGTSRAHWPIQGMGFMPKGPPGTQSLQVDVLTQGELLGAASILSKVEVSVSPVRGWRVNLDDDPDPEVIFDGIADGIAARFLLDPVKGGGLRAFFLDATGSGAIDVNDTQAFGFKRDSFAYIAFTGIANVPGRGNVPYIEALHFDSRGLIRELTTAR